MNPPFSLNPCLQSLTNTSIYVSKQIEEPFLLQLILAGGCRTSYKLNGLKGNKCICIDVCWNEEGMNYKLDCCSHVCILIINH